jgi:ABC-type sugar transport system ATPase subunit
LQFGRERGRDLQSSEQIAWPSPRRPGGALINGREVAEAQRFVPPERRNVVLMFQDFALFPHQTIIENVAFGLRSSHARTLAARSPRRSLACICRATPMTTHTSCLVASNCRKRR